MEYKEYLYKVGCKINAYLRVFSRMDDGYHELETFYYPLPAPYDIIRIQERKEEGISFFCTEESLIKNNSIVQAYEKLQEVSQFPCGFDITLTKKIPVGGGLGGGSANAGMFLRHVQECYKEYFTPFQIKKIASLLGADVPFFLQDKPQYGLGKGDILQPAPDIFAGKYCLILCMPYSVVTRWAYEEFDKKKKKFNKSLTEGKKFAKTFDEVAEIGNDFEELLFATYPVMRECKASLFKYGAIVAGVSGTGGTMFAIFEESSQLLRAKRIVFRYASSLYSYRL